MNEPCRQQVQRDAHIFYPHKVFARSAEVGCLAECPGSLFEAKGAYRMSIGR